MKKLSGFSLMEMMIVLLIVSIVAAASAPMINKKLVGVATDKSPWVWVGNENSIAYNLLGSNAQTASIGASQHNEVKKPRLYIKANDGVETPHIVLQNNNTPSLKFLWAKNSIGLTTKNIANNELSANCIIIGNSSNVISSANATVIGSNTYAHGYSNSVVVGANARTGIGGADATIVGANASGSYYSVAMGASANSSSSSVSMGAYTNAGGDNSIAIGRAANTNNSDFAVSIGGLSNAANAANSVAIGWKANVSGTPNASALGANTEAGTSALALGANAKATGISSIAIGGSTANNMDTIAIGRGAEAVATDATALGSSAEAKGKYAVALGANSTAGSDTRPTIAIGYGANAKGEYSIAIGAALGDNRDRYRTIASGNNSIAIGKEANATGNNSVALGVGATAGDNQIVLGTADSIVYIPGRLVVNRNAILGWANGAERSSANMAIIRSNRDGILEILQRQGDGDYDALAADGRVNYDWAKNRGMSDRRLKNVGKSFIGGLNEIKKLEVFNYTFKSDKSKTPRVGVMAQDLQKIFPNAVVKGEDGFLRIRMEDMFYALVNAVKENDKRITALEKENIELKKRIADLEKKIK